MASAKFHGISIPLLSVSILYALLLVIEVVASVLKTRGGRVINIHKMFHSILSLAIIGRLTYFVLRTFSLWHMPETGYQLLLPDLSSLGFYLAFLLLVFFWAKVSYRVRQRFRRRPESIRTHRTIMLGFWFTITFCLTFVITVNVFSTSVYHSATLYRLIVQICFFPFLSFLTGFGFITFGSLLACELQGHRRQIDSHILQRQLYKIGILALISVLSFALRASIVIAINVLETKGPLNIDEGLMESIFYSCVEWLPSIIVVLALNLFQWSPTRSQAPLLTPTNTFSSYSSNSHSTVSSCRITASTYERLPTGNIQSPGSVEPEFVMIDPGDPAYYSCSLSTEDFTRDAKDLVLDSSTESDERNSLI